eukprot:IDg19919t1
MLTFQSLVKLVSVMRRLPEISTLRRESFIPSPRRPFATREMDELLIIICEARDDLLTSKTAKKIEQDWRKELIRPSLVERALKRAKCAVEVVRSGDESEEKVKKVRRVNPAQRNEEIESFGLHMKDADIERLMLDRDRLQFERDQYEKDRAYHEKDRIEHQGEQEHERRERRA